MRYDLILIGAGLACLAIGEALGIYMGSRLDFTLSGVHAHLNLVGWVTLTAYGLIHRAYPALARSRLALPQMSLALIGAMTLPIGIALTVLNFNDTVVIAGAIVVALATLMFMAMFARKAAA